MSSIAVLPKKPTEIFLPSTEVLCLEMKLEQPSYSPACAVKSFLHYFKTFRAFKPDFHFCSLASSGQPYNRSSSHPICQNAATCSSTKLKTKAEGGHKVRLLKFQFSRNQKYALYKPEYVQVYRMHIFIHYIYVFYNTGISQLLKSHSTYTYCSTSSVCACYKTPFCCCHWHLKLFVIQNEWSCYAYRNRHISNHVFTASSHHLAETTQNNHLGYIPVVQYSMLHTMPMTTPRHLCKTPTNLPTKQIIATSKS